MDIGTGAELITLLAATTAVVKSGLIISGIGLISHAITRRLAEHTSIEKPDPTIYMRQFDAFFDSLFTPAGQKAASLAERSVTKQFAFLLAVDFVILVSAVTVYIISAGVVVGSVVMSYQTFGVSIDPVPVYRQVTALVVLCTLAIAFHAKECSERFAV